MSFKKLVIAIDLDSTVCDLLTEWINLYNSEYEEGTTLHDIKYWSMADNVRIGSEVYKYLGDHHLYRRLDPFPGALEAVREFHGAGHEVHILTAPSPGFEQTAADKIWWCKQHLDFLPFSRVGLIHAKERFLADVLIDDSPSNLEGHARVQPNSKRIGIAYPYNECATQHMHLRAASYENPENAWKQMSQFVKELSEG